MEADPQLSEQIRSDQNACDKISGYGRKCNLLGKTGEKQSRKQSDRKRQKYVGGVRHEKVIFFLRFNSMPLCGTAVL